MAKPQLTPTQGILVAIDIGKTRNEILIEIPGHARRRRLTVLNTRADYDRLIDLLSGLGQPVTCAFEATGNYHRPLAWRLLQAGFTVRLISSLARISHTFCDTGAIRSEKVSRCRSLTAAGQADPFRQSVFQPSASRLMDVG